MDDMEQDIHFSKKDVKTEKKNHFSIRLGFNLFSAYMRSLTFGQLSIGIVL